MVAASGGTNDDRAARRAPRCGSTGSSAPRRPPSASTSPTAVDKVRRSTDHPMLVADATLPPPLYPYECPPDEQEPHSPTRSLPVRAAGPPRRTDEVRHLLPPTPPLRPAGGPRERRGRTARRALEGPGRGRRDVLGRQNVRRPATHLRAVGQSWSRRRRARRHVGGQHGVPRAGSAGVDRHRGGIAPGVAASRRDRPRPRPCGAGDVAGVAAERCDRVVGGVRRCPGAHLGWGPLATAFWRQQGAGRIVETWAAAVGVERVRVVTVPPPGSDPRLLWGASPKRPGCQRLADWAVTRRQRIPRRPLLRVCCGPSISGWRTKG